MNGTASADQSANRMILALRRLNGAFAASNRVVGEVLGLRDGDFAVLDALSQEGPRTPTELARRTRTHVATMTGILARLERDGWIERRPDPADRRSVRIHAAGIDRLTEAYSRINEKLAEHVSGWSAEQVEMITRFLIGVGDIVAAFSENMAGKQESQVVEPTQVHRTLSCPQRGSNPRPMD